MNKAAILHIPLSQYAYAVDEHTLTIRIRTAKGDILRAALFYGDRADPMNPIRVREVVMEKVAMDDLYDYFSATIRDEYTRVCYYFLLDDGKEKTYYYERGFCNTINCARTEYFQFPYIRREDIIREPEWASEICMYHIFPDSFASAFRSLSRKPCHVPELHSVTKLGGKLAGITENLDYLQTLGINCIYLNPIFTANSYHKYDTTDYFSVDPCLGSKEDLKLLVDKCHDMGIRVILDGVFNHCGPDFFAFADVLKKGRRSEYYDWFYYLREPISYTDPPNYEAFAYVKEMPKLNTGNPEVEKYFIRVGTYWIEEVGIDGWRLDVANEVNHDFWRHFRKAIRDVKPDAFLIGEIWEDATVWLEGDQFDSTMNYRFSYLCKDFFAARKMKVSEFDAQIHKMIMRYPWQVALAQMNFLDSHDVPRFLSYCDGDRTRMELAFFYLFMSVGIPSVFYGDEHYLMGVEEPEYRQAMPWNFGANCYDKFSKWITLRRKHPALTRGSYCTLLTDDVREIYAFEREYAGDSVIVVLNNSKEPQDIDIAGLHVHLEAMQGDVYPVEK